jgi:hypothetical protein
MKLYHYTCTRHLPKILEDGFLKTVESNVSLKREHAGPDVVWLTDEDDLQQPDRYPGWATPLALVDKTGVRFTVEIEDAIPWRSFARHHKVQMLVYATLNDTGSNAADHWYVVPRQIPRTEWRQVAIKRGEAEASGISVADGQIEIDNS